MEDMYLRLDRQLAAFLKLLDEKIGAGNYTLFLTADHGGAHNAEYLKSLKIPAGNVSEANALKELNQGLKDELGAGADSLVRALDNYQVTFNEKKLEGYNRDKVKAIVIRQLQARPEVAYVADMEHFENAVVPEPIRTMMVNGYNRNRSGCIQIVFQPGWYNGYGATGTTHGTWNPYDTHIPLLWYGWHVPKGETYGTVYMTDIAATVAALLHIQMPGACVGKVITDIAK
jgi:arylsulfatase A-like enzyme